MRAIFLVLCTITFLTGKLFGQTDTINEYYFTNLQTLLAKDSTIKDIKYVCKRHKNGKVEEQHMYVKYKTDSIERFWRLGKCFHYYENGNLKASTNIDLVLKKFVGIGLNLDIKGDTTWATFFSNENGRTFPTVTIFKQGDLGKVYEMIPDKYTDVFYKKGKRKKASITICNSKNCYTPIKIYYKNDGTIDRVEDMTETYKELEKKKMK